MNNKVLVLVFVIMSVMLASCGKQSQPDYSKLSAKEKMDLALNTAKEAVLSSDRLKSAFELDSAYNREVDFDNASVSRINRNNTPCYEVVFHYKQSQNSTAISAYGAYIDALTFDVILVDQFK